MVQLSKQSQGTQLDATRKFQRTVAAETLANGLINAILNGVLAWLTLRSVGSLTLGGENSYIGDTAATAFVLPFILSLIIISLNRRKLRQGKIDAIELEPNKWLHAILIRFPTRLWAQALLLGLLATLITSPLVIGVLWATGLHEISPTDYAIIKGVWTGALAAALTLPALLLALGIPAAAQDYPVRSESP